MSDRRPAARRPHRRQRALRRVLLCASVAVLLSCGAALALGSRRIIAEEAAYSGPAQTKCVPHMLNRSALLGGVGLTVSPAPESRDANPHTQVSLLGVPISKLSDISVRGSMTGSHSGALRAYSQGDGASFLPTRPFLAGETVTVAGKAAGRSFSYSFTVSYPDPIPYTPPGAHPAANPGEVQYLHTIPGLRPPTISVTASSPAQSGGDIFAAPYSGPGTYGPMIFDSSGNLVWFDPLSGGLEATNLQVQTFRKNPVLTWWQGYIPPQGFGEGEEMVDDTSYRTIMRVHAGNGFTADLHDFHIEDASDTAFLTVFNTIRCDTSTAGGPRDGAVTDAVFEELDLATGLVRQEWHSLDHVSLHDSYSSPVGSRAAWPWDYFHINSIQRIPGGKLLISARNTWALYELYQRTGQVIARIGGRHSTIKLGEGAKTAFQHDAALLPDGEVSVFDNGATPTIHHESRGVLLAIDPTAGTDSLVREFDHPSPLLAGSQGNFQQLPNGDFFVGWGEEPWFSEFNAEGQLVWDAHFTAPKYQSYRAYRFEWNAQPAAPPAVAAISTSARGPVDVYASWNGATGVASWKVLAGPSSGHLVPVASGARSAFETMIATPGPEAYVAVQALDASGKVLATSRTIKG